MTHASSTSIPPPMLAEWIDAINASLLDMCDMLGIDEIRQTDRPCRLEDTIGNYIYLYSSENAYQISFRGTKAGFISLTRSLIGAEALEALDETEVFDGIGELANILVGNVKTRLGTEFDHLTIGLPMTIEGSIVYPDPINRHCVLFMLGDVPIRIGISVYPLPSEVRKQRALEQEIRKREIRLNTILDTAPDAIITVDHIGRIVSANTTAEQMFEAEALSLNGRMVTDFISGIDGILSSSPTGRGARQEVIGRRSNNETFPIEISFTAFPLDETTQVIVFARDISERKALEDELNHAQKMDAIGQLAAGIAHEINTPIQYVGDNTQFLKGAFEDIDEMLEKYESLRKAAEQAGIAGDLLDDIASHAEDIDMEFLAEEIPKAVSQSLEGVERVAGIVTAMKAFSHPSKQKEPVDLNKSIHTTVTVCRNEWKYVSDVVCELDETLPMVSCVEGEINQVIMNIIVNAAHAIGEKRSDGDPKGAITVTTQSCPPWAEIRIRDTGGGIPESAQEKVFEPFFTTKEVGRGTGQGLSISHAIVVKKHAGELFFETQKDVGTTFVIHLPLESSEQRF